jgi:hypothetical protein
MNPSRRRFLQVGVAGAAVLATAGWFASRPRGGVVEALVPVVLAGSLPPAPERQAAVRDVTEAFHRAVGGLAPDVQREVRQLLALLSFMPTRLAFTGIARPLDEADPADVARFLSAWRTSRFDLLRAGYQALTQLIQAAWYDNPMSWKAIGYPGPPRAVTA